MGVSYFLVYLTGYFEFFFFGRIFVRSTWFLVTENINIFSIILDARIIDYFECVLILYTFRFECFRFAMNQWPCNIRKWQVTRESRFTKCSGFHCCRIQGGFQAIRQGWRRKYHEGRAGQSDALSRTVREGRGASHYAGRDRHRR